MSEKSCTQCPNRMGANARFCNQCGTAMPSGDPEKLKSHDDEQIELLGGALGKDGLGGPCGELHHALQVRFAQAKYCSRCGKALMH